MTHNTRGSGEVEAGVGEPQEVILTQCSLSAVTHSAQPGQKKGLVWDE